MITVETLLNDLKEIKDSMVSELAILSAKRDQVLNDINKLNTLIIDIEQNKE